ncbi:SGNH/GDSL hydrolase family protein [Rhodococcus sp. JS3073]|uniref:SGNH/GDSL hydrolase family protein n=1 Tax=Rhodococcus sp. JS3073 TaxID=3002901 RepID=UPI002286360A|nr:SGNH/GDSL hydrolase family protein [Rhodococcus sp. JS3073]WAM16842.1 SGNH/GDSL hydrolase family protein [Rhodococcus sp. JS3073]
MRIDRQNRWALFGGAAIVLALIFAIVAAFAATTRTEPDEPTAGYQPVGPGQPTVLTYTPPSDPRSLFIGDASTERYTSIAADELGWQSRFERAANAHWATLSDCIREFDKRESFNPNIVILHAGQSDTETDPEVLAATVRDTIDLTRQVWPEAQVIVFGPVVPQVSSTQLAATSARIQVAALVKNAPFIDSVGQRWFTTQNTSMFTEGGGSALNTDGSEYVAVRFRQNLSAYTTTE